MPENLNMERCNSSMQLTRAADYGVRVMIYLAALPPGERVLLPAIVQATSAPDSFLSKVLQALARTQMITSRRGPAGGFEIAPAGRRASMKDVIEAIDGPLYLNVCLRQGRSCSRKHWCPAHPVWARAQSALLEVLGSAVISDLASENRHLLALTQIKTGTHDGPGSSKPFPDQLIPK